MKDIFAVENSIQLDAYQTFAKKHRKTIQDYCTFLELHYSVRSFPHAILWTSREIATESISAIPIPAYTNDFRTVFCPELEVWKDIYLRQLTGLDEPFIQAYYASSLTENHILQILGHEFVHHSELFGDGEYESGIWFEEGMCEYISRKYFLTDAQFAQESQVNATLVTLLQRRYGGHSLEEFGSATYAGDYASIFYEYWRSFLAVEKVIEEHNGDVMAVFQEYRKWISSGSTRSLSDWFHIS